MFVFVVEMDESFKPNLAISSFDATSFTDSESQKLHSTSSVVILSHSGMHLAQQIRG